MFRILQQNVTCASSPFSSCKLHWLPVEATIDCKLPPICHKFSDSSLAYLSDVITVYTPSRQPGSSADTLRIPHIKPETFGQCSFSYCPAKQCLFLLSEIRYIHIYTECTGLNVESGLQPVAGVHRFCVDLDL